MIDLILRWISFLNGNGAEQDPPPLLHGGGKTPTPTPTPPPPPGL